MRERARTALQVAGICALALRASAQGTFQNLDFEEATIASAPVGGFGSFPADAAQAFPGWTVGNGDVLYDDETLGAPGVDLMGPAFPNAAGFTPLQGFYSVLLQYFGFGGPPALSQTGMVPANAQSINFLVSRNGAYGNAVVELNGVSIPLVQIAPGQLAGNISAWAGQSVDLTFTTPSTGMEWFYFDDVTFSPTSVPEPGTLTLLSISLLLTGFQFVRRRRQCDQKPVV